MLRHRPNMLAEWASNDEDQFSLDQGCIMWTLAIGHWLCYYCAQSRACVAKQAAGSFAGHLKKNLMRLQISKEFLLFASSETVSSTIRLVVVYLTSK